MSTTAWSAKDLQILRDHYPTGGTEACMRFFPYRTEKCVRARANKLGLRQATRVSTRDLLVLETVGKGPERYRYEWQPLVPVKSVHVREGSQDFRKAQSLK